MFGANIHQVLLPWHFNELLFLLIYLGYLIFILLLGIDNFDSERFSCHWLLTFMFVTWIRRPVPACILIMCSRDFKSHYYPNPYWCKIIDCEGLWIEFLLRVFNWRILAWFTISSIYLFSPVWITRSEWLAWMRVGGRGVPWFCGKKTVRLLQRCSFYVGYRIQLCG